MKTASFLSLAIILTGSLNAFASVAPEAALSCARAAGIIAGSENDSCFALADFGGGIFRLLEKHDSVCGGDPITAPVRASFSVQTDNERGVDILGYEEGGADWIACPGND